MQTIITRVNPYTFKRTILVQTYANAAIEIFDAQGESAGYGPHSSPYGVFYGRTDLTSSDTWRVNGVSVNGVLVTPQNGGIYTITTTNVPPGSYFFKWILNESETGTQDFILS